MELRLRVGITVSLFRLRKTDTCQMQWRRSVYTPILLITSWEEITLVSNHAGVIPFR